MCHLKLARLKGELICLTFTNFSATNDIIFSQFSVKFYYDNTLNSMMMMMMGNNRYCFKSLFATEASHTLRVQSSKQIYKHAFLVMILPFVFSLPKHFLIITMFTL